MFQLLSICMLSRDFNTASFIDLDTLPRIDTQGNNSSPRDKQLQPFVQRLALLEQHVRGVQAKLYICNEDIKETVRQGKCITHIGSRSFQF